MNTYIRLLYIGDAGPTLPQSLYAACLQTLYLNLPHKIRIGMYIVFVKSILLQAIAALAILPRLMSP